MIETFIKKYDKQVTRLLEIIPGLLTWTLMTSPLWLGLLYPPAVVFILLFLTIYWSYMAIKTTIGLMIGYPKYKKEMAENWWEKCRQLDFSELPDKETLPANLSKVKHFLVIPIVNEPEEVLGPAFESFYEQTVPTSQIMLVYSIEEKFFDEVTTTLNKIIGDRKGEFYDILVYAHPAGIPGEAIGSGGGNRTWGASRAVEELRTRDVEIKDFIFSSFDADHVPDTQYLARLTHLYLTSDKRNNKFFTPTVWLFNNNHWDVAPMMRIESNFVTIGTLANRSIFWGKTAYTTDTAAAFSNSLQTLIDADFWDVSSGADDTTYFWRAFFARDGEFKAEKHYIPYSADAVSGKSFMKAHKNLYKQLLRWGWGVIEIPISVKEFLINTRVPFSTKLMWLYDHFKTRIFMVNIVFLITFGFTLLTLINPQVSQTMSVYNVPTIISRILSFTLIFLFPPIIYRSLLTPPMPTNWPLWKKSLSFLEGILVIVNLLTFSFIPMIEAQTRMMLGKKMKDLYHTPKVRH